MGKFEMQIAGLVPCAGYASRISPLPCSKEIYPAGFNPSPDGPARPKAIATYLLENMKNAGAAKVFLVLRKEKWDIPAYYGNGGDLGIPLAYLVTEPTPGAAFTIDEAYPFLKKKIVVFGFPDIYFQPANAFAKLLERKKITGADIILGLFSADTPEKVDMVDVSPEGHIRQIDIKPQSTTLTYTWMLAVWGPRFTNFIHDFVAASKSSAATGKDNIPADGEYHVGNVIGQAIDEGLNVDSVTFTRGRYLDIGTAEDLSRVSKFIEGSSKSAEDNKSIVKTYNQKSDD